MAKKEELEKIVRGKGISALRPDFVDSSQFDSSEPLSSSNADEVELPFISKQSETMKRAKEVQINKNCILSEVVPSLTEQDLISKTVREELHQIYILEAYISQEGTRGAVFKNNIALTLNICCYASGLLGKLKPELDISWYTYDVCRMQIQPAYKFSIKVKPLWQHFKISYQILPSVTGLFRFYAVVDFDEGDCFWVEEGTIFKIR